MKTIQKILLMILGAAIIAAPTLCVAAPIQIAALPFSILKAGTYVLAKNLACPAGLIAITINSASNAFTGPVVLDLQGHTLSGAGGSTGIFVTQSPISTLIPKTPSITVQNGTITNFSTGIIAETPWRDELATNIVLNNLDITQSVSSSNVPGVGLFMGFLKGCVVSNCQFSNCDVGIQAIDCHEGNVFVNDSFAAVGSPLNIGEQVGVMRIGYCTWTTN
jgi:hypothetical protein